MRVGFSADCWQYMGATDSFLVKTLYHMIKYNTKVQLYNRTKKDGTHAIRLRVSWAGFRLDHFLPLSIESKYWNTERMQVCGCLHSDSDAASAAEANAVINEAKHLVDKFFLHCHTNHQPATPSRLKEWLDPTMGYRRSSPQMRPLVELANEFIDECCSTRSWSDGMRRHMHAMVRQIAAFRPHTLLCDVDEAFLQAYMEHLYCCGQRNTSVRKRIHELRWLLRWCSAKGYPVQDSAVQFAPKFKGVGADTHEVIYLAWEELMRLRDYDFGSNDSLSEVRDVFLFCCFSGLRYSDVRNLKKSDVSSERIRVVTQKTSKALCIELNCFTREILQRYEYLDDHALPVPNCRTYNRNLKRMAQIAGIDTPTHRVHFVRAKRIEEVLPKYEVISSHCARRTFVVNALRLGISSEVIMQWTGHSDYNAMRPYIKIVDGLKAESMAKFDAFR